MKKLDSLNLMYRCDDCQRLTERELVKAEDGSTIIVFRCFNRKCGNNWELKLDIPYSYNEAEKIYEMD